MNPPENNLPDAPRPMDDADTIEGLRRQINLLFGALLISSFTLTAYLGVQMRRASMELAAIQPRAAEAVRFSKQDDAAVQSVYAKLVEFGKTHPDFQKQILSRFKVTTNGAPASVEK